MTTPGSVTCAYCGEQVDMDECCCGAGRHEHHDNHYFMPAGCRCGYGGPITVGELPVDDLEETDTPWDTKTATPAPATGDDTPSTTSPPTNTPPSAPPG